MLVSGRVNYHVRMIAIENKLNPLFVGNIADMGTKVYVREIPTHLHFDMEKRVFRLFNQQESFRFEVTDLSAHLRSYRAAGTGYH